MASSRAVFAGVLMLALASGCAYDDGRDLPPIVERATPAGALLLTSCGGSSGLIEEPSYGCTFFARGDGATVTARVARALRRDGFEVACRRPGEIAAVRDDVRVLVEVTQHGSVVASEGIANVYPAGYRRPGSRLIPAGSVALAIDASRLEASSASFWRQHVSAGGRCDARLPEPNLDEHCANWWNGVGIPTAEAALRRRVLPPVEIRRRAGIARVTCTYTLHARSGYLQVTATFEQGEWVWPPLRRVDPPRSFRPNAVLNEDGRLQLTS